MAISHYKTRRNKTKSGEYTIPHRIQKFYVFFSYLKWVSFFIASVVSAFCFHIINRIIIILPICVYDSDSLGINSYLDVYLSCRRYIYIFIISWLNILVVTRHLRWLILVDLIVRVDSFLFLKLYICLRWYMCMCVNMVIRMKSPKYGV